MIIWYIITSIYENTKRCVSQPLIPVILTLFHPSRPRIDIYIYIFLIQFKGAVFFELLALTYQSLIHRTKHLYTLLMYDINKKVITLFFYGIHISYLFGWAFRFSRDYFVTSRGYPDSKVHGAKMGPTWVLSAPDGPHVGPMNLAVRVPKATLTL